MNARIAPENALALIGRSRFAVGLTLLSLVIASMTTIAFANGQLSGL